MSFQIINPGLCSTIQDRGRFSLVDKGFSPSGAADLDALMTANALVGNHPYEGCIEMTLLGVTLKFERDCLIAISGGDMQGRIDGEHISQNVPIVAHAGSYLNLTFPSRGSARTYLAVGGGFDLPDTFGSLSTSQKFALGGFNGRALRTRDVIGLRNPEEALAKYEKRKARHPSDTDICEWYTKWYTQPHTGDANVIYALRGPQDGKFTERGIKTFFSEEYTVGTDSDRMGIRLSGKEIESLNGYDIISDGIVHGSVQVSKNGLPIILGADRQTTGGYAKIATLASISLPILGRLLPSMKVKFCELDSAHAERSYKKKLAAYAQFYKHINGIDIKGELL